jgi:hypothetical protein
MASEVKAFFTSVFYDESQSFKNLFNANYVFVNKPLANFYGVAEAGGNSSDPDQMVKVDATGAHRGGLLTMGAFLANNADLAESSPVKRAVNIRKRLMCQDPPKPDATIASFRAEKADELIKELKGQVISNRDFVGSLTKESPCDACHEEMINPLGFGLEDYDAVGRYRTTDANGLSIDSSGVLIGVSDLYDGSAVDFYGTKDLSDKLPDMAPVEACFSANVFRFAMDIGHDAINEADENAGELTAEEKQDYTCSVEMLTQSLNSRGSMSDMFTKLGMLDLVRFRKQRDR